MMCTAYLTYTCVSLQVPVPVRIIVGFVVGLEIILTTQFIVLNSGCRVCTRDDGKASHKQRTCWRRQMIERIEPMLSHDADDGTKHAVKHIGCCTAMAVAANGWFENFAGHVRLIKLSTVSTVSWRDLCVPISRTTLISLLYSHLPSLRSQLLTNCRSVLRHSSSSLL